MKKISSVQPNGEIFSVDLRENKCERASCKHNSGYCNVRLYGGVKPPLYATVQCPFYAPRPIPVRKDMVKAKPYRHKLGAQSRFKTSTKEQDIHQKERGF